MSKQIDNGAPATVDFMVMDPATGTLMQHGETAMRLAGAGFSVHSMRPWLSEKDGLPRVAVLNRASGELVTRFAANATLRKDEWVHYDTAIVEAARTRLVGVQDLMSRGLSYSIANGFGKTVLEYEDMSDMSDAELSMEGLTRNNNDRVTFGLKYLPLPIVSKDFYLSQRVLEASRMTGDALDVSQAQLAAVKVAELVENLLFNGSSSYSFGGGTVYGYTDFPHKNAISLGTVWPSASGADILAKVIAMKQAAINARHYGPFGLYVPTGYETVLDNNFVSNYPGTIRERLLKIDNIAFVKTSDKLAANKVVLVELQKSTVRMVEGLSIQTVQWSTQGGMLHHFKVMAILVPHLRADQENRSGIVVAA